VSRVALQVVELKASLCEEQEVFKAHMDTCGVELPPLKARVASLEEALEKSESIWPK
jgi:hypothetical protein